MILIQIIILWEIFPLPPFPRKLTNCVLITAFNGQTKHLEAQLIFLPWPPFPRKFAHWMLTDFNGQAKHLEVQSNLFALTALSQKAYPLGTHCLQWSNKTFRGSVKNFLPGPHVISVNFTHCICIFIYLYCILVYFTITTVKVFLQILITVFKYKS